MRPRSDTIAGWLFCSPWLIGGTVFLLLPMGMSFYYALTDYPLLKPPVFVGLDNFVELFHDDRFWLTVKNTAVYAAVFIPLSVVFSLGLAAMLCAKGLRFSRLFLAAIFVPTLVPMVASGMLWYWLFNGKFGLVNTILTTIGITGPNWLEDARTAIPALIVTSLWGVGQSVVIYVAALQEVPEQLYEAAEIDGMSSLRKFWSVSMPMVSPAILFNVITLLIGTLQVFAIPYILFRNERGQRNEGYFYTMYLYDNAFVYQKMGYASAMAWIQLLVVLMLTGVMLWASKKLVHYRA